MRRHTLLKRVRNNTFFIFAFALVFNVQAQNTGPVDQSQPAFSYQKTPIATAEYGGLVSGVNETDLDPRLVKFSAHNHGNNVASDKAMDYPSSLVQDLADASKRRPARPTRISGFEGNSWTGTPPDNALAISNDGIIVSATNINVFYYTESGERLGFSTFNKLARETFPNIKDILYDPKVLYDDAADKFILVFLHGSTPGNSEVLIFFSKTNNPVQGWHAYKIDGGEADAETWLDFPNIGVNKNELFITGNLFDIDNKSKLSVIYQIDKWNGFKGKELKYQSYHSFEDKTGKMAFTIVPIERGRGTSDRTYMQFVSNRARGEENYLQLFKINGEIDDDDEKLESTYLTVPTYRMTSDALQNGSDHVLDVGDCRVRKAIFINDIAHVVHATRNNNGYTAIMYHKFPLADPSKIETQVFSEGNYYNSYPSVGAAGVAWDDESVIISYLRSGSNVYPSVCVILVDEDMQASNSLIVTKGTGPIETNSSGTEERWGDYTSICRKYNSNTCWVFGCAGNDFKVYQNGVSEVSIDKMATATTPEKTSVSVYPNPVQDRFAVSFEIKQAIQLEIVLYDVNGKLQEHLLSTYQRPGFKEFSFNKGALNHGVYFLSVEDANGKAIVTKQIIIE